jgi:hypothetical protein
MDMTESPANYIRYAGKNPEGIIPEPFRRQLITFLSKPDADGTNPADIFTAFYQAARNQPRLQSTFYNAVKSGFDALKKFGVHGSATRWNRLMPSLIATAIDEQDATLEKHLLSLVADTVPHLIVQHAGHQDFEIASDILFAAGQTDLLRPTIHQSNIHQVVKWYMGIFGNDMVKAAAKLTELRASKPFAEEILGLETKRGSHVAVISSSVQGGGMLVLEFSQKSHGLSFYHIGQHSHKRGMTEPDALSHFGDDVVDLLESELDSPHTWVQTIALDASCRLNNA